jgi:protease-4
VKPVIISQGMVAASGGYWISMTGDEILASPYTITGSIGVISGHIWDKGVSDKLGMDYDVIKVGESADINSGPTLPFIGISVPKRPVTKKERERAKHVILDLYADFTEQVAKGREMPVDEIRKIAKGRIWTGSDGLENGLIDEIGGLWESVQLAKSRAGLAPGERMELVEGPTIGMFNVGAFQPSFFGIDLARFGSWFGRGEEETPAEFQLSGEPWDKLPVMEKIYLEQILKNNGKPVLMMDPISIEGVTLDP